MAPSGEDLVLIPVLLGYRYTLNQTGTGFYVEPNAGYSFGASSIEIATESGGFTGKIARVAGPTAGLGFGYLIDIGRIPFNFGLRYEHNFASTSTNVFAFRISHSFSFRKRESD